MGKITTEQKGVLKIVGKTSVDIVSFDFNVARVPAPVALDMWHAANKIAREGGAWKATRIVFGDVEKVVSHVRPGYRKKTTGEYVPNAYGNKFGWHNTYYQQAETVVQLRARKYYQALSFTEDANMSIAEDIYNEAKASDNPNETAMRLVARYEYQATRVQYVDVMEYVFHDGSTLIVRDKKIGWC